MKALGKYIVISKITEDVKSKSGLIMTTDDSYEVRYNKGTVLTPGVDVSSLKEGDTIYYDKVAGHTVRINDSVYTIIREIDVVLCSPC